MSRCGGGRRAAQTAAATRLLFKAVCTRLASGVQFSRAAGSGCSSGNKQDGEHGRVRPVGRGSGQRARRCAACSAMRVGFSQASFAETLASARPAPTKTLATALARTAAIGARGVFLCWFSSAAEERAVSSRWINPVDKHLWVYPLAARRSFFVCAGKLLRTKTHRTPCGRTDGARIARVRVG